LSSAGVTDGMFANHDVYRPGFFKTV